MSTIYVNMSNVPGDATQTDFLNQIQCSAILQDFSQPVESAANPRTQGVSEHRPLVLFHQVDQASPLLRQFALANTDVDEVTIKVTRLIDGSLETVQTIELTKAKVDRVQLVTLVDEATGEPGGELLEAFSLSYGEGTIKWISHRFGDEGTTAGNIQGAWNLAGGHSNVA